MGRPIDRKRSASASDARGCAGGVARDRDEWGPLLSAAAVTLQRARRQRTRRCGPGIRADVLGGCARRQRSEMARIAYRLLRGRRVLLAGTLEFLPLTILGRSR